MNPSLFAKNMFIAVAVLVLCKDALASDPTFPLKISNDVSRLERYKNEPGGA